MCKPAPLHCAGLHNLLPVILRLYCNKLTKLNIQFLNIYKDLVIPLPKQAKCHIYINIIVTMLKEQRWPSGKALGLRSKRTGVRFPASPLKFSEIGYLRLPSRDMVQILLKQQKSSIQPTNDNAKLASVRP